MLLAAADDRGRDTGSPGTPGGGARPARRSHLVGERRTDDDVARIDPGQHRDDAGRVRWEILERVNRAIDRPAHEGCFELGGKETLGAYRQV